MARESGGSFEIPAEMRAFAEKSVEQAKQACESFLNAAQNAVNTAGSQVTTAQSGVSAEAWGAGRDFPWHFGGPVAAADRPGPRTSAINSKSGDQAQRRQSGLSCKPGREERLGAGVASQALSPGAA